MTVPSRLEGPVYVCQAQQICPRAELNINVCFVESCPSCLWVPPFALRGQFGERL